MKENRFAGLISLVILISKDINLLKNQSRDNKG
jgi:hypothetical protein